MTTVIETQETALIEEIREITSAGRDVTVACDDDYDMAGDFLNELKHKEKLAREWFAPMVRLAYTAHKAVKARENEVIEPLVKAKKALGAVMGLYQTKKEVERRAEATVKGLYQHASSLPDKHERQKMAEWAVRCENRNRIVK